MGWLLSKLTAIMVISVFVVLCLVLPQLENPYGRRMEIAADLR
jgi:hypothetical protein